MRLLERLFGKKKKSYQAPLPTVNLTRWRQSGEAQRWVQAHNGRWNHQDWLALLETLQRSAYWPMQPEEVGRTLEEIKVSAGQRN